MLCPGRKEFVNDSATKYETNVNMSEPVNSEEKLIVNPKERHARRELPTKPNGISYEDAVNNSGENVLSHTSVQSVAAKLDAGASPGCSQTSVTVPTEAPSFTSSVQSPTSKMLSTAAVTSVSVKGALPLTFTDTATLESTSVVPESYRSKNTKNDNIERVRST
jgi:hypothetical protein